MPTRKRILLLGSTGTIGSATLTALRDAGHDVTCLTRPKPDAPGTYSATLSADPSADQSADLSADLTDPAQIARAVHSQPFDAILSCLASRSGTPRDARTIDRDAHLSVLRAAQSAGISQFVLLSAICVQKPELAFQHAKLEFESALIASGLTYSIVRPTAYFKSLSGQVDRLRAGKPFLLFGNGTETACKPISDGDLARYLTGCLTDPARHNAVLPIGGPGPSLTPRAMGEALFAALGLPPKFRHVPLGLMTGIITALDIAGLVSPALRDKAQLARIGRYYARESMLVWDAQNRRYDADATPETGTETLFAFYDALAQGKVTLERGDHAVF